MSQVAARIFNRIISETAIIEGQRPRGNEWKEIRTKIERIIDFEISLREPKVINEIYFEEETKKMPLLGMSDDQVMEHINQALKSVPDDQTGALLFYGNKSEIHGVVAIKTASNWSVDLDGSVKLDDIHNPKLDFFVGVKKTWGAKK